MVESDEPDRTSQRNEILEDLLRLQEARGLRVPIALRLAMMVAALLAGIAAPTVMKPMVVWFVVTTLAVNLLMLRLLKDPRRVGLVGTVGAFTDLLVSIAFVLVWYRYLGGGNLSAVFISKGPFTVVALVLIVINGLALRPIYPLIVTGGAVLCNIGLVVAAVLDPRTIWSTQISEIFAGPAISWALPVNQTFFLVIVGLSVARLTQVSRRTARAAAALQMEQAERQQAAAQMVMDAKLVALTRLVAGISHEMNTPLGVVTSSVTTTGQAAGKLRKLVAHSKSRPEEAARLNATLSRLEQSAEVAVEATARLADTLETMRGFVALDEADFKRLDLNASVEGALQLVPTQVQQGVRTIRDLGELPEVHGYASRLNQALLTVLTNAFESIEGDGSVMVRSWRERDEVCVRVADSGRGMSAQQLQYLFDVNFNADAARVRAGMGLAACRSVVRQHRGAIKAESEVGKGTVITITLPIR